jgi:hypothetical protein
MVASLQVVNFLKLKRHILYGITLILLAVVILACGFLNFGLSFVCCLVYFPIALLKVVPRNRTIGRLCCMFLLVFSPCGLLVLTSYIRSLQGFSAYLFKNIFVWNHGLPFIFVQPLIITLAVCIAVPTENSSKMKVKIS